MPTDRDILSALWLLFLLDGGLERCTCQWYWIVKLFPFTWWWPGWKDLGETSPNGECLSVVFHHSHFVWSHPWHGQKTNDILAIFLLIRSFLISVKQMLVYFFRCFPLLRLCTVFLWPLRGYFWPWHLRRIHAKANTSQNYWVDSGLVVLNNKKRFEY